MLKYFLPLCGLSFHVPDGALWSTRMFNFDEIQFIYFSLIVCAFGVISKKSLQNQRSWRFTPMLSSMSFIVLVLTKVLVLLKF